MEVLYRIDGMIRRGKVVTAFKTEDTTCIAVSCTYPEGRLDLIRGVDIIEKSTPSFVVSTIHPQVQESFFKAVLACYKDVIKELHTVDKVTNVEFYSRLVMGKLKDLFRPYELTGMRDYYNRDIQAIVSGIIKAAKI